MPALQDLGTASPLLVQKEGPLSGFSHSLRPCLARLLNLLNFGSRFPRLEQRFCSAGAGLLRFSERLEAEGLSRLGTFSTLPASGLAIGRALSSQQHGLVCFSHF